MSRMESPDENYERVSVRLSGDRLDRFEEFLEEHDASKSAVVRRGIDAVTSGPVATEQGPPFAEPDEDRLARAYRKLYRNANTDGVIGDDAARRVCAGGSEGYSKAEVKTALLRPLHKRGYLRRMANIYGDAAWRINGWDR